jgi:hypothetical protein
MKGEDTIPVSELKKEILPEVLQEIRGYYKQPYVQKFGTMDKILQFL